MFGNFSRLSTYAVLKRDQIPRKAQLAGGFTAVVLLAVACSSTPDAVVTGSPTSTNQSATTTSAAPLPDARFPLPGGVAEPPVLVIRESAPGGPIPIEEAYSLSADIVVYGNGLVRTRPSSRRTGIFSVGFVAPDELRAALDRAAQAGVFEPGANYDGDVMFEDGGYLVVHYRGQDNRGTLRVGNIGVADPEARRLRVALGELLSTVRTAGPANAAVPVVEPEHWQVRQIGPDFAFVEVDGPPRPWPLDPSLIPEVEEQLQTLSHAEMLDVFAAGGEPLGLASAWEVEGAIVTLSFAPRFEGE